MSIDELFQRFQLNHKESSTTLMRATYYSGDLLRIDYNKCAAGPDTDASKGLIDIQLNNVTSASRGTYVLINLAYPETALKCVVLKVLGKC